VQSVFLVKKQNFLSLYINRLERKLILISVFSNLDAQYLNKNYTFATPNKGKTNDSVAQLVEHYTFNVVVLGSNPSGITRFKIKMYKALQSYDWQGFCFHWVYQSDCPIMRIRSINKEL
jgi:hypothetical protein